MEAGVEATVGLSIKEAAAALGLSEKAVRNRIKQGDLAAWKVEGKFGPQWRVSLDGTVPEGAEGDAPSTVEAPEGTVEGEGSGDTLPGWKAERAVLLGKIAGLEADKARLWDNVEAAARERGALVETLAEQARALEAAQHNARALEAKLIRALPVPDVPAEPEQVDIQGSMPEEPEQQPRRPWWKVWG